MMCCRRDRFSYRLAISPALNARLLNECTKDLLPMEAKNA